MKRFLRDPLVQFLALGALFFAGGMIGSGMSGPDETELTISTAEVERLLEGFRLTWRRPPTESEFAGLMEEYLKEEVMYREALAMGLDRDDQVVRRRLRQKLELMTADFVATVEPSEGELLAFLNEDPDRYRLNAVLSFRQAFVRTEGLDEAAAAARAADVLATLEANPEMDPSLAGDPFLYPAFFGEMTELAIANTFGTEFRQSVLELPVGSWSGPVASAYGLHLVRVDVLEPGRVPELNEVRDQVYRDLVAQRVSEAEQAFFEGLLEQYAVSVEWPEGMDPVDLPGVTN